MMITTYEMKMVGLVMAVGLSALMAVAGYFVGYSTIKYKPKWQRGRGVGVNLQGGLVSFGVFVVPFCAILVPLWNISSEDPIDWGGAIRLMYGTALLVVVIVLQCSLRFVQENTRRYFSLFHAGLVLTALSMLLPGLVWLVDYTVRPWLQYGLLGGAYCLWVADEWLFLKANDWHFLPKYPK